VCRSGGQTTTARTPWPAAFTGADKLLFVSANGPDDLRITQHRAVVDTARAAGVGLVAYTSIADADTNPINVARVHRDTEQALTASGLPTVLLRNGWYTENYTATLAGAVERGAIVGSAGPGRIASATRADLAEAAASSWPEQRREDDGRPSPPSPGT
jgi:NAD(P)H dehydrogenase (quinone)